MENNKNRNAYGAGLVFLSTLMFGSYGVWSRLIGDTMGDFFQGWTRALLILIIIVPLALFRKEIVGIRKGDKKWLVVFLIFTSLTQAPIFYAFNHMDIGTATLLYFVSFFLTMNIVGVVFMGEKFNKVKIASAVLALAGKYLVFSFSLSAFALFAALMAIANGVASGGEVAFSKKLSDKYSPLYLITLSWAIILLTNSIISVGIGEPQVALSISKPWFWQLCYSVVSLFGFWFVIAGLKYVDVGIGALISLLEIIFSVAFGIFIFGESLTLSVLVGGLLILTAVALPNIKTLVNFRKSYLI